MLCHEGLLVLAGAHVVSGAADPQAVYVHAQIHDKEFWPQKIVRQMLAVLSF